MPEDATVEAQAELLWAGAAALEYARLCYRWTAENLSYGSAGGTWTDLDDVLASGRGECGDFASVSVSLLRNRDMPARHLASVRPDGTYRVWADFYLAGYGWIPADPTYARSYYDAHGEIVDDYLGYVAVSTGGIIMHEEVHLPIDVDGATTVYLDRLQSFSYWNWYSSGGAGDLIASYPLSAEPL